MATNKKPRVLSTQDLSDTPTGPIYVLNTSGNLRSIGIPRGGDVYITVQVGQAARTLNIPRTWVPVEVTSTVPRKAVLESLYFLEAVANGLITPINTEDARAILEGADAREELSRLRERENAIRETTKARGIGRNVTVAGGDQEEDNEQEPATKVARKNVSVVSLAGDDGDEESTVSASFQGFVLKLNSMDDVKEARNAIKVRGGELSEEEARYMLEHIKYPKIKSLLRKSLGDE